MYKMTAKVVLGKYIVKIFKKLSYMLSMCGMRVISIIKLKNIASSPSEKIIIINMGM